MNQSNKVHFDTFPEEGFKIFVNCLETQGYVIDSKPEQGYSFSTTQLDNMTEEVFYALIEKFGIDTEISYDEDIFKAGGYYPSCGGYSILFNDKIIGSHKKAKRILDNYLSKGC